MPNEQDFQNLQQQVETLTKQVELLLVHQHLGFDGSYEFQGETVFKGKELILGGGVIKNGSRIILPLTITDGQDQDWLKPDAGQRQVGIGIQISGEKGSAGEQLSSIIGAIKPGKALTTDASIPSDQINWNETAQILSRLILASQGAAAFSGPSVFPPLGFLTAERSPLVGSIGTISAGGSSLTDSDAVFQENAFVGSILVIYNSAGNILEAFTIIANTTNVITIGYYLANGTPVAQSFVNNGSFTYGVRTPVLLGSAEVPYARGYFGEDIRLGYGSSGGSQPRYIKWGYGSPEGVVTANIGSMYLRFDGGAGTTLYIKEANNQSPTGWSTTA